jgi:hypothetical protein
LGSGHSADLGSNSPVLYQFGGLKVTDEDDLLKLHGNLFKMQQI